jgi:hypothetical protein
MKIYLLALFLNVSCQDICPQSWVASMLYQTKSDGKIYSTSSKVETVIFLQTNSIPNYQNYYGHAITCKSTEVEFLTSFSIGDMYSTAHVQYSTVHTYMSNNIFDTASTSRCSRFSISQFPHLLWLSLPGWG